MKIIINFFALCGLFVYSACHQSPTIDFEKEKAILLQLDEQAREFHFTKNAKDMVDGFSSDYITISKGVISRPTYEDRFKRFEKYFNSVDFIKWDNVTPPVVRFSDDASVAYVVIDKLVVLTLKEQPEKPDTTHFAWLSVFKKINGKWTFDCVASTNK